jgi:hypothetical protein
LTESDRHIGEINETNSVRGDRTSDRLLGADHPPDQVSRA